MTTAAALANWLHGELQADKPDVDHMIRVLIKETDDWVKDGDVRGFAMAPASTGCQKWDALLEGLTAYRATQLQMSRPNWTLRTSLEVGWNPYDDGDHPPRSDWALLSTLETPVEMLGKGVTLSRRNLKIV